jgi:hypothetical protein
VIFRKRADEKEAEKVKEVEEVTRHGSIDFINCKELS